MQRLTSSSWICGSHLYALSQQGISLPVHRFRGDGRLPGRRAVLPGHHGQPESSASVQNPGWFVPCMLALRCVGSFSNLRQSENVFVLFGSPDMKSFRRLLKRGDDGGSSKGSAGRDEKENDAGRGQTPSRTSASHQVSHSHLTLQVLIN